jgi:hypothetical protein
MNPTWFDWIADVIAPFILGFGAIAVGFASLRVARSSHLLAERLEERAADADLRVERTTIAQHAYAWIRARWGQDDKSMESAAERMRVRGLLSVALSQSEQPQTNRLQEILWRLDAVADPTDPVRRAFQNGALSGAAERHLAAWLIDPAGATLPSNDSLDLMVTRLRKASKKAAKKRWKRVLAIAKRELESTPNLDQAADHLADAPDGELTRLDPVPTPGE